MIHVDVADGHDKSWCKVNANALKKSAFKIPMRIKLSAVRETRSAASFEARSYKDSREVSRLKVPTRNC